MGSLEDATKSQDFSIREHRHTQLYPYRLQSNTYAPEKGGDGKPRFSVEVMVYVPGGGLDRVDPMVTGNEIMVMFRNYVRMKEFLGYRHIGLNSDEITTMMEKLWGKKY